MEFQQMKEVSHERVLALDVLPHVHVIPYKQYACLYTVYMSAFACIHFEYFAIYHTRCVCSWFMGTWIYNRIKYVDKNVL